MQPYPVQAPSYSAPSPAHQQQPLFIIIPGGGGKSGHKQPAIIPASAYARHGLDYQHHDYHADHAHRAAARRLSPLLLGRRSASLLKRGKSRGAAISAASLAMMEQQQHASGDAAGANAAVRPSIALHSPGGADQSLDVFIAPKTLKTTHELTHELSAKTSHLANRFRARHRELWSARGSGRLTPSGSRPKAIGVAESLPGGNLEDSSRYFVDGEEEASAKGNERASLVGATNGESIATDFSATAASPSKHNNNNNNNDDKLTSTSSSTETLPPPPP